MSGPVELVGVIAAGIVALVLLLQLFVVSRVLRYLGVRAAICTTLVPNLMRSVTAAR